MMDSRRVEQDGGQRCSSKRCRVLCGEVWMGEGRGRWWGRGERKVGERKPEAKMKAGTFEEGGVDPGAGGGSGQAWRGEARGEARRSATVRQSE